MVTTRKVVESRLATPRPDQSWFNRVGAPWQRDGVALFPRRATAPPLQQVSGFQDPVEALAARVTWRRARVAHLPEPRSQWRDRTGFSPVSLSALPNVTGEPDCRGTILAVTTLPSRLIPHHHRSSCVSRLLRDDGVECPLNTGLAPAAFHDSFARTVWPAVYYGGSLRGVGSCLATSGSLRGAGSYLAASDLRAA